MLILKDTSSLLRLITGSAGQIAVAYSVVDATGGPAYAATGDTLTDITTATTTTIVPAPAAATIRNVKSVTIANESTTVSNALTVQQYDGTDTVPLWSGTLLPGENVIFDESGVWTKYGSDGVQKASVGSGQFVASTILTTGTTFTTGATTRSIRLRMVGGGGGGGGCSSVASAIGTAGGGGAGGYAEKNFVVTPNTAYTYAIGSAGAGNSNAAGGNGGNTTFAVGATTVTAFGGSGAPVATAVTTLTPYIGGTGGVVSTNGDVNAGGEPGAPGIPTVVATPLGVSGNGGSSEFGAGGKGLTAVGNGNAGIGFGSGGGGAFTGASAVRTGGAGTAGMIAVDEYT